MKQENNLIKEIELMEREKFNILNEAKMYMAKGSRQLAKTCLKRKMDLETTIERRSQALANLRTLITNIEDAHSNSAVLSAYKTGSDILRKFKQNGLTPSNVTDITDDIHEVSPIVYIRMTTDRSNLLASYRYVCLCIFWRENKNRRTIQPLAYRQVGTISSKWYVGSPNVLYLKGQFISAKCVGLSKNVIRMDPYGIPHSESDAQHLFFRCWTLKI